MSYLDYIILAVIAIFTIKGLFRGIISEVMGLAGLVGSLILATKYMSNAAAWIAGYVNIPPALTTLLGFLLVFVACQFSVQLIIHFLHRVVQYTFMTWLDKLAGSVIGFLKGAVIISLLALLISMIPLTGYSLPGQKDSKLLPYARDFAPKMFNMLTVAIPNSKSFYGELKESFDSFSKEKISKHTDRFLQSFRQKDVSPNDAQKE